MRERERAHGGRKRRRAGAEGEKKLLQAVEEKLFHTHSRFEHHIDQRFSQNPKTQTKVSKAHLPDVGGVQSYQDTSLSSLTLSLCVSLSQMCGATVFYRRPLSDALLVLPPVAASWCLLV